MKRIISLALALFLLLPLALSGSAVFAAAAPTCPPPAAAAFTATPLYVGTAEGSLAITAPAGAAARGYLVAWGNADGPLADYKHFPEIAATGERTVYYMPESIFVPTEADRLLVYAVYEDGAVSLDYATAYLPIEFFTYDYGTPIFEFGVASDIHINEENFENYNDHFKALLADLKATVPGCDALYINGDIADWGKEVEYQMFRQFIDEAALSFPVYANYGNHDSRDPNTPGFFRQYANSFDLDTMYYTVETEEANFILFVSSATNRLHEYLYLDTENLAWLEETLATLATNGKKTFLMFHQPLANTVAGSEIAEGELSYVRAVRHTEVSADEDIFSILLNYPDVVLFTSHTHYTLEAEGTMRPRDSYPYMINTAATAYIAKGDGVRHHEEAQALYVAVYEDKVLVRGRDVLNGKWLPTAQFVLDFGMPFAGAMGPVPTPPVENDPPVNDPPAKGGCGGALTATMPVCLVSLGVAILLKKRKH